MKQSKCKNSLFVVVSLIISTLLGFILAEIGTRIVTPHWSDQWKMLRLDPVYARGLKKNVGNAVIHGHSREFSFRFSTNSQGLRMNYDLVNPKPPHRKRILLVGDSFTFGYGVEQDESFAERLQKVLDSRGYQVEVVNAGSASGFTLDTEYLFTREVGKNWRPDVVIAGVCLSNDLSDLGTTRWDISNGRLVAIKKSTDWMPLLIKKSGLVNMIVKGFVPQLKAFWHTRADSNNKRSTCEFPSPEPAEHVSGEKLHRYPPQLDTDAEKWSSEQKAKWIMEAWAYHASTHGYQLMMLFIPDAEEVQWDTSEKRLSSKAYVRSVFAQAAAKAGVEILDPVKDMRQHWCQTGKSLYFNVDGHWNAGGHRFIGEWLGRDRNAARLTSS